MSPPLIEIEECPDYKPVVFDVNELPLIWIDEVGNHNLATDCWTLIDGIVYDVTRFIRKHPGGPLSILKGAGVDATTAFAKYHRGVNI